MWQHQPRSHATCMCFGWYRTGSRLFSQYSAARPWRQRAPNPALHISYYYDQKMIPLLVYWCKEHVRGAPRTGKRVAFVLNIPCLLQRGMDGTTFRKLFEAPLYVIIWLTKFYVSLPVAINPMYAVQPSSFVMESPQKLRK